ncbi:hypothetical protein [Mycolicibacterium wolinskyi]|uniref:hypothetical protein n=1 Tax=Mycolicibacterium wolinskyi TaxID=59750 RepID=UPI0018E295BB|nr:hypothetical protein [Mycolicibacterium wolinskyi]
MSAAIEPMVITVEPLGIAGSSAVVVRRIVTDMGEPLGFSSSEAALSAIAVFDVWGTVDGHCISNFESISG